MTTLTENIFWIWDFDTPFSIDYNYCATKVQRLRSKRQIFNEISFSSSQNPLVFFIFKCIKHVLLQLYQYIGKWKKKLQMRLLVKFATFFVCSFTSKSMWQWCLFLCDRVWFVRKLQWNLSTMKINWGSIVHPWKLSCLWGCDLILDGRFV